MPRVALLAACADGARLRAAGEISDSEMIRATRGALALISGKWSVEVLYVLASGTRRYSEIFYEVGVISKKTLTQTLRLLQRRGLIRRRAPAGASPRVEYSLTPLGWSITGLLTELYEWSATHLDGGGDRDAGAAPRHAQIAA